MNEWLNAAQDWADIPDYPGFFATEDGEIRNKHGRRMSQWRERDNGTYRVRIKGKNRSVAYLVLSAFTGLPVSSGYRPKHANKDRSDNHIDNLVWAGRRREL